MGISLMNYIIIVNKYKKGYFLLFIEQLGVEFAEFLLELIENPPETDVDEQIPDLFLTLLLAYNLQFENIEDNILLNALEKRDVAKTFCEKVLLLLNREGNLIIYYIIIYEL